MRRVLHRYLVTGYCCRVRHLAPCRFRTVTGARFFFCLIELGVDSGLRRYLLVRVVENEVLVFFIHILRNVTIPLASYYKFTSRLCSAGTEDILPILASVEFLWSSSSRKLAAPDGYSRQPMSIECIQGGGRVQLVFSAHAFQASCDNKCDF